MLSLLFALSACAPDKDTDDTGGQSGSSDLVDGDGDGFLDTVDCNDADATVHPAAEEVWYDGTDQDCDGADDDQDGDGYALADDCDDADPTVHPSAGEIVGDGVDQDCDGADTTFSDIDGDNDGDGYPGAVDCDDADPAIHPGATDTSGDGVDQDCDGVDDPEPPDADGDGYASQGYNGTDCDDTDANINPGQTETIGDDVDSDCDGADFGVDGLSVGDLVITEIMYDSDAVGDSEGEWFEVYNDTGHSVNLLGLVAADDPAYAAGDIFTVSSDLVAAAGARVVFCVNSDTSLNGGIPCDYDYAGGGVNLNNAGDDLYVGADSGGGTSTIDSVTYDETAGWPAAKGMSIELKGTKISASSNDTASNWCLATGTAGSTTDKGSPGAASSGC